MCTTYTSLANNSVCGTCKKKRNPDFQFSSLPFSFNIDLAHYCSGRVCCNFSTPLLTEHAHISLSPAYEFPFTSNYTTRGRLLLLVWYELLLKISFNTHYMAGLYYQPPGCYRAYWKNSTLQIMLGQQ